MRKLEDALRLKFEAGQSHQQIARALGISKGLVTKYVGLAVAAGLDWQPLRPWSKPCWSAACWLLPPQRQVRPSRLRTHSPGAGPQRRHAHAAVGGILRPGRRRAQCRQPRRALALLQ